MQNKDFEGPVAFDDHKLPTQPQRRGERQGVGGCAVKSSCLTKGKGRRDSAPAQGGPKNPMPQKRPYKDRNLKGQNSKQPICFSRNAITKNQISKPKPNRAQQSKIICSGDLCLSMRSGGAHGPPRFSEVSWWGPGHRRSQ